MLQYLITPNGFIVDATNDLIHGCPILITATNSDEIIFRETRNSFKSIPLEKWNEIKDAETLLPLNDNKNLLEIYTTISDYLEEENEKLLQYIFSEENMILSYCSF
jgi:hypothetical protein